MRTADFTYDLPTGAIAQEPAEPRDSARLLDGRSMVDHRFSDLPELLEPGDLVVVNRTRVRRARLVGEKEPNGGRVEVLLLTSLGEGRWQALVRPSRRLRKGVSLRFGPTKATIIAGPDDGRAVLEFAGDVEAAVAAFGELPLPPYFSGRLPDSERYQTVYAERVGSAAAPTAGLHFTDEVIAGLRTRGVGWAAIDLEIGLDTFRPIATDRVEDHVIHTERFRVPAETADAVNMTKASGGRVVAIGTTVVRSLESAATAGRVAEADGSTGLFILPGHRFSVVDLLITNFHVPGSSLVVLIAAFMGPGWREVYTTALARGYRFLSFGDAMLARAQ